MNMPDVEATRCRVHPGIAFIVTLACSALAQFLLPSRLITGYDTPRIAAFGVLLLSSFALWGFGFMTMRRAGTGVEPGDPVIALVTSGPFRFSRNPLYVALVCCSLAFALLANSLWFVAGTLVLWLALQLVVIPSEERCLERRFGEAFRAYGGNVRRWI
jgi:protein-S-isoprenylcysteine O-methyltransferase Ste14